MANTSTGRTTRMASAKNKVAAALAEKLAELNAVDIGGGIMAVPTEDSEGTVFVTVTLTGKNPTDYTTAKGEPKTAFDPVAVKAEYDADKEAKAQNAAQRAADRKSAKGAR